MNNWGTPPWSTPGVPPPWYTPGAHPPTYAPPTGYPGQHAAGYWGHPWNRPLQGKQTFTNYRSALYPNLNPILAADTTLVRFDVKKRPLEEIQGTTFHTNRQAAATMNSTTQMRLFSKLFPWAIDIKSTTPITCEDVWEAIFNALQEPLADSEWGLIIGDKDRKVIIEMAMSKREGHEMHHMKRVDWLGDNTMFKGLEQDDDFQKARLFPGTLSCPDTYIVKLGVPV